MAYDIFQIARQSNDFRREVATGPTSQVVVMTLQPGEEIGEEIHDDRDQILLVVEGDGETLVGTERASVRAEQLVLVPSGTNHNVINTGGTPLRLITVYAPPEHEPGTVHRTKAEADAAEADHHS